MPCNCKKKRDANGKIINPPRYKNGILLNPEVLEDQVQESKEDNNEGKSKG